MDSANCVHDRFVGPNATGIIYEIKDSIGDTLGSREFCVDRKITWQRS